MSDPQISSAPDVQGDGISAFDVSPVPSPPLTDEERRARAAGAGRSALATLYRRRWWIVAVTMVVAAASVAVALSLPVQYAASTQLLTPESDGGGLGALIGSLSPMARGVLGGGGGGDYSRYLAILNSRPVREKIADEFDLVGVYNLRDDPHPEQAALDELDRNVDFVVDLELDFLELTVFDADPQRAARMANTFAELLNVRNAELSTSGAASFRQYMETRYNTAVEELDRARTAMQSFQERNGVVELPALASAYTEALATQRAEVERAELTYRALLSQFGPENADVQAAQQVLASARGSQQKLLSGQDRALPLSYKRLPAITSGYAALYQDVLIQTQVIETVLPILEQARFGEERERVAVQTISPASPPVRKARPQRAVIVLASTLSAFVLACVLAVLVPLLWNVRRALRGDAGLTRA